MTSVFSIYGSPEKRGDGQLDVGLFSSIVHNCIQEDKLSKLRATLNKFTRDERRRIVYEKINGNAPLFTACNQGKHHFVSYLLRECAADIEMAGIYEVEEDHSRHEVTPLWCAAVANKLEVVKILIEQGADVNSPSDTQSTPVRSACYMTNTAVIKYLVDHGANIHKPNINGGTCLINSVQDADLCAFLINKGADVNAMDNSGNLALHYAIREGRKESVKLLLRHKSDFTIKNDFGDDALQTAALRGFQDIVEVILEYTKQSDADAIRAYELLGSNFVDEKNDMVAALVIWKKAMALRYKDKTSPILKQIPEKRSSVFCNVKEPETQDEIKNVFDPEEIQMLALLIRERILGPFHKDTTFGLMYRGAVYADSHRYQRCVDLWKYAYILRNQKSEPLNQECHFTIQALVKLFWEIQVEVEAGASDEKVQLSDALDVLYILTEQIKAATEISAEVLSSKKLNSAENSVENVSDSVAELQIMLQLWLHLIHLVSRLDCTGKDQETFMRCVHDLVTLSPKGTDGVTLLHLAVDPKISLTSEEFYSSFPSLAVIQILVVCGADVNAQCDKGNTPTHNAIRFLNLTNIQEGGILKFLLQSGAHVDITNEHGFSALSAIQQQGLPFCPLNYVSLKCLTARVIVAHDIKYENDIPSSLEPYIELHRSGLKSKKEILDIL